MPTTQLWSGQLPSHPHLSANSALHVETDERTLLPRSTYGPHHQPVGVQYSVGQMPYGPAHSHPALPTLGEQCVPQRSTSNTSGRQEQTSQYGVVPFNQWPYSSSQHQPIHQQDVRSNPARLHQTPSESRPPPSVHWSGVEKERPKPYGKQSYTSENSRGPTPAYGAEDWDKKGGQQWNQPNPAGWGFSSYRFPVNDTIQQQPYPNSFGIDGHDGRNPFGEQPDNPILQQPDNGAPANTKSPDSWIYTRVMKPGRLHQAG